RALSDLTRLRILALLREGECCVGDLVTILGAEQPSVSRHLAYLRRAGLVRVRKTGPWAHYSLAEAASGLHAKLIDCLACCPDEVPQVRRDLRRRRQLEREGGCCPQEGGGASCGD